MPHSPQRAGRGRRRRTGAAVVQGLRHLDSGGLREALVWFAEALRREAPAPLSWREEMHRIRLAGLLRQIPRLVQVWLPPVPAVRAEFSPEGKRLVAASEDGSVRIFDLDSGGVVTEAFWHEKNINRLSFSSDGRLVVSASDDCTARVWDILAADGGSPVSPPLRHPQWVTHAAFSPEGASVVTGCVDGSARVWDWSAGRQRFGASEHGGMLWCIAFSPEGQFFATAGWDGCVRVWDARDGTAVGRGPLKHGDGVRHAVFSGDGRRLATASDDQTARLWSVATGEPLTWPLKHAGPVRRVAFSQDNRYLLTWTDDGAVGIWEADSGVPRSLPWWGRHSCLPTPADRNVCPGAGPGGRRQIECGSEGVLRLWDWGSLCPGAGIGSHWLTAAQRRSRKRTSFPSSLPAAEERLCSSTDGRLFVTRTTGGLRVHDAATGEAVTADLTVEGTVEGAVLDPDGRLLTAVRAGKEVRTWDLSPDRHPVEGSGASGPLSQRLASGRGGQFPAIGGTLVAGAVAGVAAEVSGRLPRHVGGGGAGIRRRRGGARTSAYGPRRLPTWKCCSRGSQGMRCCGNSGGAWARAEQWQRAVLDFERACALHDGWQPHYQGRLPWPTRAACATPLRSCRRQRSAIHVRRIGGDVWLPARPFQRVGAGGGELRPGQARRGPAVVPLPACPDLPAPE